MDVIKGDKGLKDAFAINEGFKHEWYVCYKLKKREIYEVTAISSGIKRD
jgi:hypothetical protein